MAIAIVVGRDENDANRHDWFCNEWRNELLALDNTLDIRIWPNLGDAKEITAALVWRHSLGVLNQLSSLKLIASLAAGVDHVLVDRHLPNHVPIVRVTDNYMANDIVQYVLACALHHIKRMSTWEANQKKSVWSRKPPFNYVDKTIGIMGLGFLGEKAAQALASIGLKVIGWRSSAKQIPGIKCYWGEDQFSEFLSQAGILICMLPLTPKTENILNSSTFAALPKNSYLINLGRGEHLIENDLLVALASGHLSGACLDVFRQEPLPADHPFWSHEKIRVTPHIASVTHAATAAPQILENYQRILSGKEFLNKIDLMKGY